MPNQPTIVKLADVAKRANVSLTTASRVLNNVDYPIKKEKRLAVLKAQKELGYQVNLIGRMLKTQINPTVGVIVPDFSNPFFTQLIAGVEKAANKHHFFTTTFSSQNNPQLERELIQHLRNNNVRALLLSSTDSVPDTVNLYCANRGIVCLLEANFHLATDAFLAEPNAFEAGRQAARYLLECGHTRIAFLTTPLFINARKNRVDGVQHELSLHGVPFSHQDVFTCNEANTGDFDIDVGKLLGQQFLEHAKEYTAIVAVNDIVAIQVMDYLKTQQVRIPDDVSIISFDNIAFSRFSSPKLTTIHAPSQELGSAACDAVIQALQQGQLPPHKTISLPSTLIIRESVKKLY